MSNETPPPPPPEPPLVMPESVEAHEVEAIKSILIKTVRSDTKIKMLNEQLKSVTLALDIERKNRANGVNALSIYGFDPSQAKLWDAVAKTLGREAYNASIRFATDPPLNEKSSLSAGDTIIKRSEEAQQSQKNVKEEPAAPLKIGDSILLFLKGISPNGAKIGSVKEYLSTSLGSNLHEKTPGMTLYRLLKEGKVRRDGRTWFYVAPASPGTTESPGAEAPGNLSSVENKETTEC